MNLTRAAKVTRVSNAVGAGQTPVESAAVDTTGFEGAEFLVAMGTITGGAVTSAKLQGRSSTDDAWADLEGAAITIPATASNKLFRLDLGHSQFKLVRCVVSRATQDSIVNAVIVYQYLPDRQPVEDDSTVGGSVFVHAPDAAA